jgi:PAS domain S-box-containing protein
MRRAAGGWRWIDWSVRSLPDELGLYLVGRDVTERKQAEREVEGLLESSPDAVCVIDERARIVRVNVQLERMFGHARSELLGQPIEVLVPEQLRERHRGHVARFLAEPSARPMGSGMSLIGQRADGSQFPVEVSLGPVQTEARTLIACTLRDIGERRRLEHTMMAILDAAPDAMITVDRAGIIRMVNRQTERLFGYPREALLGHSIELLVPERWRAGHAAHVESFAGTPRPRSMAAGRALRGRHRDGHEFAIQVSLSPVETADGLLIASAIRAIDE